MEVSLIPAEFVSGLLPKLFPHINKAAKYTFGRYEPEDIVDAVLDEEAHLWVVIEGEDILGVTITRFWQYPRKKCLDVMFLGGEDWDEWRDNMFDILQRWASDNGCDAIESSGRTGFARVFKSRGYTPLWQVFEFPVGEAGVGGQNG
jgi:hypothetical protein